MHTLLLRIAGPMQSWGTRSRFDERDSELEPSKSGMVGLLCAAMGIARQDTASTLALAALPMGVRVDREGRLRRDYQTAHSKSKRGIISTVQTVRYYLADAVFLVGFMGQDLELLQRLSQALQNPVWVLSLGRKSYVPSPGVWLPDGLRQQQTLTEALAGYPNLTLLEPEPQDHRLTPASASAARRLVLETSDSSGSMRFDQPISNFAERRYGARFVSTTILASENPPATPGGQ
jgi:CRISPR system Cascade subunit CasD